MMTAPRTCPGASYDQYTQPVLASMPYTKLLSLPMNTAPPTTVGCVQAAEAAPGNANAHLSFSCDICRPVSPPASSGWNRYDFVGSGVQPFHLGFSNGSFRVSGPLHWLLMAAAVRSAEPPKGFPVTSSAIARSRSSFKPSANVAIGPVVMASSTRSGSICRSVCRLGAKLSELLLS